MMMEVIRKYLKNEEIFFLIYRYWYMYNNYIMEFIGVKLIFEIENCFLFLVEVL